MNKVLIVMLSTTSALSVKALLEKRYKIRSNIISAPSKIASLGCAYCLEIDAADAKTAINIIKVSGISTRGVYTSDTYERIF